MWGYKVRKSGVFYFALEVDNKFDMVAGTNNLLNAANGGFMFSKEKCIYNDVVLNINGRDQENQWLNFTKNLETLVWKLEQQNNKNKEYEH